MVRILNLTQHPASAAQKKAGVFEPTKKELVKELLTFQDLPRKGEIMRRASAIAYAVPEGTAYAMIGGAPFLMGPLEAALLERGVTPLYAFSCRESIETTSPSGEVVKKSTFKHLGFIEV